MADKSWLKNIEKDDAFLLAERYVNETDASIFLTGKAGTGKTTFLRYIVQTTRKRFIVLAPTGVASINAQGSTIHSFFCLPLCPYLPDVKELVNEYQDYHPGNIKEARAKVIKNLDLMIIDEISMVRADILDAVDMVLRKIRKSEQPFGGVQLLMLGDVQQLSPVLKNEDRTYYGMVYDSPYFFRSKALSRMNYLQIQLNKIHRQTDRHFIDILNEVRKGYPSEKTIEELNSRYNHDFKPPTEERWIQLCTHVSHAHNVNTRKLEEITTKPRKYKCKIDGKFPPNLYPAEASIELKEGAQVMFIRNGMVDGVEYYNGKIGTVKAMHRDWVEIEDENGVIIKLEPVTWENTNYVIDEKTKEISTVVEGIFRQLPLRLAWAITIHKSQGLTFDKIMIDAGDAFSAGQVYVALSRCRSLEGIVLTSRIKMENTFCSDDVLRYEGLYPTTEQAHEMFDGWRTDYLSRNLRSAFDLGQLYRLYKRLKTVYSSNMPRQFDDQAEAYKMLEDPGIFAKDDEFVGFKRLAETSGKFIVVIDKFFENGKTDELRERVVKGAGYFCEQLLDLVPKLMPLLDIKINNESSKDLFDKEALPLLCELEMRLSLYMLIAVEDGFDVKIFKKLQTKFELNDNYTVSGQCRRLKEIAGI